MMATYSIRYKRKTTQNFFGIIFFVRFTPVYDKYFKTIVRFSNCSTQQLLELTIVPKITLYAVV